MKIFFIWTILLFGCKQDGESDGQISNTTVDTGESSDKESDVDTGTDSQDSGIDTDLVMDTEKPDTDSGGGAETADTAPNQAPDCAILEPPDGATFPSGELIQLSGETSDPEGDQVLALWDSSLAGPIAMGESWYTALSDGTHTLTFTAEDTFGGVCVDSVTILVGDTDSGR